MKSELLSNRRWRRFRICKNSLDAIFTSKCCFLLIFEKILKNLMRLDKVVITSCYFYEQIMHRS